MVIVVALAGLLVAAPALAQDPYGEVLPGDLEQPGDGAVAPDADEARAPGAGDQGDQGEQGVQGEQGEQGEQPAAARADRAAVDREVSAAGQTGVVVAGRHLPVTGFGLAAGLVLALGLIGGGVAALMVARRRTRAPDSTLPA